MAKSKYAPNKLNPRMIEYLQSEYANGTLNIAQASKKFGVSRMSIYRHLHKKNLVRSWKKERGLWDKIKDYFGVSIH
jgi:transposase